MRSGRDLRHLGVAGHELFEGRFEVRAVLGAGSFGRVLRCFDRELGREVALKELHHFDAEALLRFKKEFRCLSDVQHTNLVRLFELLEREDRRWAFSMELVPGCDFLTWVRGDGASDRFDEARLRDALCGLTHGLSALHALGMLHRDVKPENIRVTPEGRVVLLDFGLVTHLDHGKQTTEAAAVGTAAYMAPEQASQRVGPAADFYAVGVLLYEALTGRLPFEGSALSILFAKSARPPSSPREHNPSVSRELETLCLRLLERDANERAGADDVLRALGAAADPKRTWATGSGAHLTLPLVGRDGELDAIRSEWQRATRAGFRAVLLEGPSGIGKTALMEAAVAALEAEHQELLVLRGRCHAAEQVRYKAWDGVVDALFRTLQELPQASVAAVMPERPRALTTLFPLLAQLRALPRDDETVLRDDAGARRFAMFEQFGELLLRLSWWRPLVLCVDDLQWSDLDSLALLQVVSSLPRGARILFLGTVRPAEDLAPELAAKLDELMRMSAVFRRLSIGALDREASSALAADLLGMPAEHPTVAQIAREALGIPWCAVQMAQGVRELGLAAAAADLEGALRQRVARLGPEAQRVMQLLAVAGGPQPFGVMRRALGMDSAALEHAISALRAQKLVRASASRTWLCYHDRVREAVAASVLTAVRKAIHAQLAQAWQWEGGAPERIAGHYRNAEELDLALPWIERAAEAAEQTGAFGQAASLHREALAIRERRGDPTEDVSTTRLRLADALASAGAGVESANVLRQLFDTAAEDERDGLRVRVAEQLLRAGRVEEGLEAARAAFEGLAMTWPRSQARALVSLLWRRATLRVRGYGVRLTTEPPTRLAQSRLDAMVRLGQPLSWADLLRAGEISARYLISALEHGDREHVGRALLLEGMMSAMNAPERAQASELFRQASVFVERVDSPSLTALQHFAHGTALMTWGDVERAVRELQAAQATYATRCSSETWQLANVRSVYMPARIAVGEHRGFQEDASRWISDARLRGDRFAITSCVVTGAGYTRHLMADDPERALLEIDEAMEEWQSDTFGLQQCFALTARQVVQCYAGGHAAFETVERVWDRASASVLFRMVMTREFLLVSRASAALAACVSEPKNYAAQRALASACQRLRKAQSYFGRSGGVLLLAQKAWLENDLDTARELALQAERGWAKAGFYCHRHAALLAAACTDRELAVEKARSLRHWLGEQGWAQPERALQMLLPIYPLLERAANA